MVDILLLKKKKKVYSKFELNIKFIELIKINNIL